MTQSVSSISSIQATGPNSPEEQPDSLWNRLMGFIFAEAPSATPIPPLEERKILQIDPKVLRESQSNKPKGKAKAKPAVKPEAKVEAKPAVKPEAKVEAKPVVKPKIAPPSPKVVIDSEKVAAVAAERLQRLAHKKHMVNKRISSLKQSLDLKQQQIAAIQAEINKVNKAKGQLRSGARAKAKLKEYDAALVEYNRQVSAIRADKKSEQQSKKQCEDRLGVIVQALEDTQKTIASLKQGS